jgi:hypothetical protein
MWTIAAVAKHTVTGAGFGIGTVLINQLFN